MSCSRQNPALASHYRRKSVRLSLAAAVAAVLASQSASAFTLTWNDADPNNIWDTTTTANWIEGVAWVNAPDPAIFGGTGEAITLGVPIITGGLTFNSTGYTIGNGGTAANTLTLSGATPTITVTNATDSATISAVIEGTAGLKKTGAGTLTLSGLNSYTGATVISAGVLSVDTLANGGVNSSIGASTNASSNLSLGGGTLRYTGATVTTDRAFALTTGSGIEVTNAATTLTFDSNVSGGGFILTKTGSGTLALKGTSDNGGLLLSVAGGEVDLAKPSTSGIHAVAGITSVAAGATVKLTGTGTDQISNGNTANRGVNGLAGTLDLNGNSEDTSYFAGTSTGLVTNSAAGKNVTWTVGVNDVTSSFAGKIEDGNSTIALIKTGTGTQILSGTNTYTGGTTVNGGLLQVPTTASLPGYNSTGKVIVNNGGTLAINVGSIGQWNSANIDALRTNATFNSGSALGIDTTGGNFTLGTVPGGAGLTKLGGNTLTFTGTLSNAPLAVFAGTLDISGTTQAVTTLSLGGGGTGSTAQVLLNGGTVNLGGSITYTATATNNPNGATISGGTLNLNAARTITVNDSVFASEDLTISSIVANGSGSQKLIKAGTGTLVLTSANTYGGGTDIGGGVVALGHDTALGSGAINFTAANVGIRSSDTTTRNIGNTITFSNSAIFGSATTGDLIFTGAINTGSISGKTFTIANGVTQFKGAVNDGANTANLIKDGAGTLIFSGANTTAKAMVVNAGTLTLDYSTNDTTKLSDTGSLTLGNATLNLSNTTGGGAHVETVASTTINGGAKITRTSGTNTINLNTITRNAGGTLDVASGVATTDSPNVNGILGGWATTNGTDWAINSTNGDNGAITGLATYTDDTWAAGNNTNAKLAGADPGADATTNSLRFNAAGAKTLTLSGTTNTVTSGGILVTSGVGANATIITGSTLVGAAGGELIVHQHNTAGSLTIASVIADNGAATGLIKNGAGTLILSGNNTYTGSTTVNAGTLQLNNVTAASTGSITVNNGGKLSLGAAVSNAITLAGGTLGLSTAVTIPNTATLTVNSPSTINTFNPATGTGAFDFVFNGKLQGAGDLNVVATTNTNPDAGGAFRLRGGNGAYTGTITVGQGAKLELQIAAATGGSPIGTGKLVVTGGTISSSANGTYSLVNVRNNVAGNTTFGNNVEVAGTGAAYFNMLGNTASVVNFGDLKIGNGQSIAAVATTGTNGFTLAFSSVHLTGGNATFTPKPVNNSSFQATQHISLGTITENVPNSGIIMDGAATLTLTGNNTYTGDTTVSSGTLKVSGSIAGSSQIAVKNSGSLVLAGASADRIGNTASLTLGSTTGPALSSTLQLDNSAGQITESVGALTLANNSILDLGTGSAGSVFRFADSSLQSWTPGATLSIYNWSGNAQGTGIDQLFFGNSAFALTSNQLNSIMFYSDAGATLVGTAAILPDGQLIAPVPEPTTLASGLVMLGYVFFHRRRAGRWTNMGRRDS